MRAQVAAVDGIHLPNDWNHCASCGFVSPRNFLTPTNLLRQTKQSEIDEDMKGRR